MVNSKVITTTLMIIIFGGIFMSAFISPFVEVDDIEDNWVDKYFISNTIEGTITFLGSPFLLIGTITEFFSYTTSFDDIEISINGTGEHDDYTLDGNYIFNVYNLDKEKVEFVKDDDPFYSRSYLEIDINETDGGFNDINSTLYYKKNLFSSIPMYLSTNTGTTGEFSTISSFEINHEYSSDYNFNSTATGSLNIDYNEINLKKSFKQKVENVMDNIKEKVVGNITTFGIIPEFIGLPLVLILIFGLMFEIISLIRGA